MTAPRGDRHQFQGEVLENTGENDVANDHCRQTNDNGAPAGVDIGKSLVLGIQGAGQRHNPVGDHQSQNLVAVDIDSLGPAHVGVGAGGPDAAAQLRSKNQ